MFISLAGESALVMELFPLNFEKKDAPSYYFNNLLKKISFHFYVHSTQAMTSKNRPILET